MCFFVLWQKLILKHLQEKTISVLGLVLGKGFFLTIDEIIFYFFIVYTHAFKEMSLTGTNIAHPKDFEILMYETYVLLQNYPHFPERTYNS